MNSWRSWWESLTPDSKNLIISIVAGVAVLLIGGIGYLMRQSIVALGRRIFAPKDSPAPTPPQPIVIEFKQPTLPVAPEPAKPALPSPSPYLPPSPVVGFVPRRDTEGRYILERLKEEFAPEKKRLVALCGAGGVGKTTLAAEAVRSLSDIFVNRLAWVSADGRPEFNLSTLLDEISTQLGNTELRPLPLEQKQEQVRTLVAAAPTLIVLDNFETVADAEQARCAGWLSQTPCSAIITSRDEVEQARPVNISAMSLPEARILIERLITQARHPHAFKGLEHDTIIAAADRNPLVLQWIIRQIDRAKQPHVVLRELMQGEGDAAERVFGRSFELLTEDSRAALLALSLFVPSASRPALAQTAGFGADLKRLDEALAQSTELWLTNTTEGNERLTIEGLTRELAKAQLSKDPRAAEFRQRFVAYFLNYTATHAQPTPEDYNVLEAERENLLSAIDVASDSGDWQSVRYIAYIVAEPTFGMLGVRGYWDDVIKCNEQAMTAAREANNEGEVAGFSTNIAAIRINRGEYDEARQAYQQALVTYKKLGEDTNVAAVLNQLGKLTQEQGEIEEARRLYNGSLEIVKRLGDQSGIAVNMHNLAVIAQEQGEIEEARRLYNGSLEITKKLGNQNGIAMTLHQLAILAQKQGEIEEAQRLYNESLKLKKSLGDQKGIANTIGQLGLLAAQEGNKEEAMKLMREALGIFEKLKSPNAEMARRILERLERESS